MIISSLEEMEQIVCSRSDLEWEGWNVVRYTKNRSAMYSQDGAFHDGQWMKKVTYPLTEQGWIVPNSFGRANAAVEK